MVVDGQVPCCPSCRIRDLEEALRALRELAKRAEAVHDALYDDDCSICYADGGEHDDDCELKALHDALINGRAS